MRCILEGLGDPRKKPTSFSKKFCAAQEAYEASDNYMYQILIKTVGNNMAGRMFKERDIDTNYLHKMDGGREVSEAIKQKVPQLYGQKRHAEFLSAKQGSDELSGAY